MSASEYEEITAKQSEGVLEIVLNKPERLNSLTFPMIGEIRAALAVAAAELDIRVVVLRGAGRAFCAGDNIRGMGELPESVDRVERFQQHGYFAAIRDLRALRKPVIAVVKGHALGAGCELAMAADIRLVAADAKIGIPFVKLALAGGTYQLPRLVGFTRALELLFSGRSIDGREALQYGWATEVHDVDADLESAVKEWTEQLRAAPTRALGLMKAAVYRSFEDGLDEGFGRINVNGMVTAESFDRGEGRKAWTERRAPEFRGY